MIHFGSVMTQLESKTQQSYFSIESGKKYRETRINEVDDCNEKYFLAVACVIGMLSPQSS